MEKILYFEKVSGYYRTPGERETVHMFNAIVSYEIRHKMHNFSGSFKKVSDFWNDFQTENFTADDFAKTLDRDESMILRLIREKIQTTKNKIFIHMAISSRSKPAIISFDLVSESEKKLYEGALTNPVNITSEVQISTHFS